VQAYLVHRVWRAERAAVRPSAAPVFPNHAPAE
jgi:hypothetical protein